MKCDIRDEAGIVVMAIVGDVDLESSPELRTALLSSLASAKSVLVDMSGVTYIDSSGVASLVEAFQKARQSQAIFALASVSEAALRVLELARLDQIFAIHANVADGLKAGRG